LYKSYARDSGLKGAEVVAELTTLHDGEMTIHGTSMMTEEIIVDLIVVEQPSQEECQDVNHRVSLGIELTKANS
jgi:hypothetical protein